MTARALTLITSWIAGIAGHYTGDYLEQPDWCAQQKQHSGRTGWRALARHVAGYAACQTITRAVAYRTAGIRVPLTAQVGGALTDAVIHGVIDDGRALRRYAETNGKPAFHDLADHGINGRALMDQAAHLGIQIPLGAIVTTLVAAGRGGNR